MGHVSCGMLVNSDALCFLRDRERQRPIAFKRRKETLHPLTVQEKKIDRSLYVKLSL